MPLLREILSNACIAIVRNCSDIIKDNVLGYPLGDDRYDNLPGKTGHQEKHIEKGKCFDEILNVVREKNISQPMIGQLNINSIRNKFYFLEYEASKHLDILLTLEIKTDESFP